MFKFFKRVKTVTYQEEHTVKNFKEGSRWWQKREAVPVMKRLEAFNRKNPQRQADMWLFFYDNVNDLNARLDSEEGVA